MNERLYGIVATDQNGQLLAYTGRAGEGWLSPNLGEMFIGYSEEGVKYKIDIFKRQHTSLRFDSYTRE
jgi:hypothetical protein